MHETRTFDDPEQELQEALKALERTEDKTRENRKKLLEREEAALE